MNTRIKSPGAIAEELGSRLKQARLNANMTQAEVAEFAGITRKAIINAEKGHTQLEQFIAVMSALDLLEQVDLFLPTQDISPIQLAKLQGKKRKRASGQKMIKHEAPPEW